MKPLKAGRFLRFVFAGGVNTIFGLIAYMSLIVLGVPIWLALLLAGLAGIAFNFISLGGFAFRDLSSQRLPRFVACYLGCYLLNLMAIGVMRAWIPDPLWAQVLLTLPMALLSYWLMSRFVFTGKGGLT
ncbi:MAG: GtrA family protein [Pseudomonadota bacterium]